MRIVEKIKMGLKKIKDQYEAQLEVRNIFRMVRVVDVFKFKDIDVQITYDPTYLRAFGFEIAACIIVDKNKIIIATDDNFKGLEEDVRSAIILHEIAHFINEDYKDNLLITNIKRTFGMKLFGVCSMKELRADKFAIEHLGQDGNNLMIRALTASRELFSGNKIIEKEINARIQAII